MEYGAKDHGRFRDAVQQRSGDDRSALAVRGGDEASRSRDSSPKYCAFDGGVLGRFGACSAEPFQHVFSNSVCGYLAGPRAQFAAPIGFRQSVETRVLSATL